MSGSADHQRATTGAERERRADSPAQFPAPRWREILIRAFQEGAKDNIALVAAGVAFYAFLAIVPLMGATVLTYGLIARSSAVLKDVQALTAIAPPNVAQTIGDLLLGVIRSSRSQKGFGIVIALAVAIWGARNAAGSMMIALNIAYEEEEQRGFAARTLTALAMTLGLVLLGLAAIVAIGALHYLQKLWPGSSEKAALLGRIATYPVIGVGAAATAATIYRYGPSRQKAKWIWLTPGSIFSAVGWLVTTIGFGLYVTRFANYNATYGSLGGVVALLTWIYLSSYVFLLGAELNNAVEYQTVMGTTKGGEEWSADHVAERPGDRGKKDETGKSSAMASDAAAPGPGPLARPRARAGEALQREPLYLISRTASFAGSIAGRQKIGVITSILSTVGLSLLRTRGKAKAGAALLGAAAGLAFLGRAKD
ncbi:MAG: YihY/virulence factor BrkB family protein [Pseudomonadota bacterium]|nr:YihY/virulence factor BrkB family protein [Pseudomonadota bacterium]